MSKTILTIDDSRMMREMLLMVLQGAGFNVVQAEDGVEGLEALARTTPDVIITDINMPRMDGYGVIEGVRQDPGTAPPRSSCSRLKAALRKRAARATPGPPAGS